MIKEPPCMIYMYYPCLTDKCNIQDWLINSS